MNRNITASIAASLAIPSLFRPVSWDGHLYIDGGVTNPLPLDCVATDSDITIAIDVNGLPDERLTKVEPNPLDIGFVATQMKHGLRLAGTVELGAGSEPDWRRAQILHHHMRELFPGQRFAESNRWFGDRPTLPDYLPMISRSPQFRNAILALGHQHLGQIHPDDDLILGDQDPGAHRVTGQRLY
mgnify:CR=1 FL=1